MEYISVDCACVCISIILSVDVKNTYIPFLRGLNLALMALKSGLSSGCSAQHSLRQSLTQSKLFSNGSRDGLENIVISNLYDAESTRGELTNAIISTVELARY